MVAGNRNSCARSAPRSQGVSGAAIILIGDDTQEKSLLSTDPVSTRIAELQLTFDEGPGVDAHTQGRAILEFDLEEDGSERWPAFGEPALEAGARAVFGFPLRVGGIRLGALSLHSDRAGKLKEEQHRDALIVANLVARAIVLVQSEAQPEQVASELRTATYSLPVVNQAAGMASIQLGVTVGQALVRLRRYAFGSGRPIADVASEVVSRTLRFDRSGQAVATPIDGDTDPPSL